MDEKLIKIFNDRIHSLYKGVAEKAGFNLFILDENYFLQLKNSLGDDFEMVGYFIDNELVGFCTLIRSHDDLDAHFVGYDPKYNNDFQLYLNMLYDMIEKGIEQKVNTLIFARTAMAIKSSVGAVAYDMSFFLKHNNRLINRYAQKIYRYFEPSVEWEPRNPFGKN